jgi:hypothetical protein
MKVPHPCTGAASGYASKRRCLWGNNVGSISEFASRYLLPGSSSRLSISAEEPCRELRLVPHRRVRAESGGDDGDYNDEDGDDSSASGGAGALLASAVVSSSHYPVEDDDREADHAVVSNDASRDSSADHHDVHVRVSKHQTNDVDDSSESHTAKVKAES